MTDNVGELIRDRYDRIDKKLDRIIGLIESLTGRVSAVTMARKYVPASEAFTEWLRAPEYAAEFEPGRNDATQALSLTPIQCRAARALLNMPQSALARRSGVSERAVFGFENGETKFNKANREAVRQTFEAAGVVFIGETGVWLNVKAE